MPSKHILFYLGMEQLGVSREDLEKNYKYAGGDHKEHLNYWNLLYGTDVERPPQGYVCPCTTKIKWNCYITNGVIFHVVGNCCIKKFMPNRSGRSCEECNAPHKNRKDNLCNSCREKNETHELKDIAGVWKLKHRPSYVQKTDTICACGKACGKYPRCYNCNLKLKSN